MQVNPGRLLTTAALLLAACAGAPPQPVAEVAPKGELRVAVAIGPSGSPFWATRDAAGKAQGVTVELGKAAAAKLGVPLQLVEYPNSGQITANAAKDAWDVTFMPAEEERGRIVEQGPAYVLYESTYLVRAGSDIRHAADVDREGIRAAAIEGTATSRTIAKQLKHAKLVTFPQAAEAQRQLGEGKVDALAMGRDALSDAAKKLPGTRLLDEAVQSTAIVIVVPKEKPASRTWAASFLETAKSDGTVRRALDSAGFADTPVAPPGKR